MRFVFVMDPMDRVLPDKDTTFAFLRAAQAKGHESLHCEPRDLVVRGGDVYARVQPIKVSNVAPHTVFGAGFEYRLADAHAVFIRKDPPFDTMYHLTSLLLERLRGRTVLINDPRGLREANEKLYALNFARWMPKTVVTSSEEDVMAFVKEVGGIGVIKPLDLMGGTGVMMVREGDKNARAIIQLLSDEGRRLVMVQEFIPKVTEGDKRILLLDGKPLGAINRVPRADDLRSNIHVGGSVEPCEITATEHAIIEDIAPRLAQDGLVFVGLDVIDGRLTEVNVTSPTGIQQLSQHQGREVSDDVIAWAERAAEQFRPALRSIPAPTSSA
ncbi:MAG: glutathione synthase [Labilithrix sp.]|nr:glutathione synthase [Labilithrix sp.]MCW5810462.1 glutathione synthase [Labilithrix sp.]